MIRGFKISLFDAWLDRRFLLQTFSHSEDNNVEGIRKILVEDVAPTHPDNVPPLENEVM